MPNDPSDVAFDQGWEALLETATLVDVRGAGYTNVKNAGGFLSVGDTRSGARYV